VRRAPHDVLGPGRDDALPAREKGAVEAVVRRSWIVLRSILSVRLGAVGQEHRLGRHLLGEPQCIGRVDPRRLQPRSIPPRQCSSDRLGGRRESRQRRVLLRVVIHPAGQASDRLLARSSTPTNCAGTSRTRARRAIGPTRTSRRRPSRRFRGGSATTATAIPDRGAMRPILPTSSPNITAVS
jgi:hypothetical protein